MKIKNNVKTDITSIEKYFVENFYINPNNIYTIAKINKNTNVDKKTVKLVVDMLRKKKLITKSCSFKLNLETVEFLEMNLKSLNSQELTRIAISIAIVSLLVNVIVNLFNISLFWQIVLLIYMFILYKYIDTL